MKFAQTYHFAGEWLAKTQQQQQQPLQQSQRPATASPRGHGGASLTSPDRALHPPAPFSPASSAPPQQLSAPVQRRGLWKRTATNTAAGSSTAGGTAAVPASTVSTLLVC
jgi:hypothetical protein